MKRIAKTLDVLVYTSQKLFDYCEEDLPSSEEDLRNMAQQVQNKIAHFVSVFSEYTGTIEYIRYTNAPEAYDYQYVRTTRELAQGWREIAVSDLYRFDNYQTPRYHSGMYSVVTNVTDIYPPLEL